jgi:hypothetical protein
MSRSGIQNGYGEKPLPPSPVEQVAWLPPADGALFFITFTHLRRAGREKLAKPLVYPKAHLPI